MQKRESNKIITFSDVVNLEVFKIEKKYNLEESDEDFIKKINNKIQLNLKIIFSAIKNFVAGKITEEEFVNYLQKELRLSKEVVEKIFFEIKNNIIPLIKISNNDKDLVNIQNTNLNGDNSDKVITQKIKKPISVENILSKPKKTAVTVVTEEIKENAVDSVEEKQNIKSTKKNNKSDTYREKIG